MTVVFTIASPSYVIVGSDSAVTLEFADRREYETGRKLWPVGGAYVTTWGARDGNQIGLYLREIEKTGERTITEIAQGVDRYLREEYRPHEGDLGNVGFHVAGFEDGRIPRVFHSFWEPDGYLPSTPPGGGYGLNDHSPGPRGFTFLYNGRNDLAHRVVQSLIDELRSGKDVKFALPFVTGGWRFVHFVLRFASELTPEVGPPFVLAAVDPAGAKFTRHYQTLAPIEAGEIEEDLAQAGFRRSA